MMRVFKFLVLALMLAGTWMYFPAEALAQSINIDLGGSGVDGDTIQGETVTGRIFQIIALITVLSLAPSIFIMATSFTRIIVVLSFVRTAVGLQQTPPNNVIIALALFMTFFIMQPTFEAAYEAGVKPLMNNEMTEIEAFEAASEPFKEFMLANTRSKDMAMFYDLAEIEIPETIAETPMRVLIPAFMISELQRAFEIGFMLFLPFLIIDIVTAAILMSMGMMMLPPVTISLPFKIVFFVIVDGWSLIVGSLLQSYGLGAAPSVGG